MSGDDVNDYGLGSPNTQANDDVLHERRSDPLAHGLGGRDSDTHEHDQEDLPEGGRRNRLEHGLVGEGYRDDSLAQDGGAHDPLRHGLGAPGQ